jgi:hypothetical protein
MLTLPRTNNFANQYDLRLARTEESSETERSLYFEPAKSGKFLSPTSPYFKVPTELSKNVYVDPLERKRREREERW